MTMVTPAEIRAARKAAGLTQQQLADLLGFERTHITSCETGRRTLDQRARLLVRGLERYGLNFLLSLMDHPAAAEPGRPGDELVSATSGARVTIDSRPGSFVIRDQTGAQLGIADRGLAEAIGCRLIAWAARK